MSRCVVCQRRTGGTPWTMTATGRRRVPMHLECARVVREAADTIAPALTAAADPKARALTIRALAAVVRIRSRKATP